MGLRGPAIEKRIQDLGGLIGPEGLPELVDWIDGLGADDWVIRNGYPTSPLVPKYWHQIGYDPAAEDHPVVGIPVEAMHAYASWYGKRLPTWTEWDATARGTQGHEYPQGLDLKKFQSLDPDSYLLTTLESPEHLTRYAIYRFTSHPVDEHDPFAAARGVMHLFGNASEMVSTVAQRRGNIVIKGRNWQNGTRYNKLSFTATGNYSGFYYTEGFRCAKSN